MADVWDGPEGYPVTPGHDGLEGYPTPDGFGVGEVTSGTGVREARRIVGVNYLDGAGAQATRDAVEGGRYDLSRRVMVRAWKRLMRLAFLAAGPVDDHSGVGDVYYHPYGDLHFAGIFECPSSGSGTVFTIQAPGGVTLRSLWIRPGIAVRDSLTADRGDAQLVDCVFQSNGSALITVNKTLNADRSSALWLVIESKAFSIPYITTEAQRAQRSANGCRHSCKTFHSIYVSFAAAFPSDAKADGVAVDGAGGTWFCDQLAEPDVDLSQYSWDCVNTACPRYEAFNDALEPYHWTPEAVSLFLFGRGGYRKTWLPPYSNVLVGLDDLWGLFHLIGLPGTWIDDGGTYPTYYKSYHGVGAIRFRAGVLDDDGYEVFENFAEAQSRRVAGGLLESDDVGLLAALADQAALVKRDPKGGAGPSSQGLLATSPGYTFEAGIGVRRVGLSGMGETADVSMAGEGAVQRVRPKRYTSASWTVGARSEDLGETALVVSEAPQAIVGVGFDVAATWRVPAFCRRADRTDGTAFVKAVGGTVAAYSMSGDLLTLEFALARRTFVYANGYGGQDSAQHDCGGNVVSPDVSWEVRNPGAGCWGGDRQSRIYPGDVLTFDAVAVDGVGVQVVAAEAFGGGAAIANTLSGTTLPGVPKAVQENHHLRDKVVVDLTGRSGQLIKAWVNGGGLSGGDVSLASVKQSAVSPPLRDANGSVNNYVPTLKIVDSSGVTTLDVWDPDAPQLDYEYDPVTGIFYVAEAVLPLSGGCNLFAEMWVYDRRVTRPCEIPTALDRSVDVACGGWITLAHSASGASLVFGLYNATTLTFAQHFDLYWEKASGVEYHHAAPSDPTWKEITLEGWPGEWEEKWAWSAPLPSYTGQAFFLDIDGIYASGDVFCQFSAAAVPFPARWSPGEILQAKMDVRIAAPSYWKRVLSWTTGGTSSDESTDMTDPTVSGEAINLRLECFAIKNGTGDLIDGVGSLGVSVAMEDLVFYEAGTFDGQTEDEWRGTVDVTALMVALAANSIPDDTAPFFVITGPGGFSTGDSWLSQLLRWLTGYTYDTDGSGNLTSFSVTQWSFSHNGFEIGNFRIQGDGAALASVDLPMDTSGYDLCAGL